jgi:hypothetical protein
MTSISFIRMLVFLCVCYSLMSISNALNNIPFSTNNNNNNLLFRYYESFQPSTKSDSVLLEEYLSSLTPSGIQRRNVIMPRICYYARVSGTRAHQKLCLPYDSIKRS